MNQFHQAQSAVDITSEKLLHEVLQSTKGGGTPHGRGSFPSMASTSYNNMMGGGGGGGSGGPQAPQNIMGSPVKVDGACLTAWVLRPDH